MVTFSNINSSGSSSGGGSVSGTTTEILNDVSGTTATLTTTIGAGTYDLYISTDGGTTFVLKAYTTDYTISGQTITFVASLTSAVVKFEYTT